MRERVQRTVEILESESKEEIYVEIRSGGGGKERKKVPSGDETAGFLSFFFGNEGMSKFRVWGND